MCDNCRRAMHVTPESKRAVLHHAEQLWDATRGIIAAYAVDTGDETVVHPLPWAQLSNVAQMAFLLHMSDVERHLRELVVMITEDGQ